MKIFLVPAFKEEEELKRLGILPDATVEAEYGERVIRGTQITLAHHGKAFEDCPAPCNAKVPILDRDAVIIVSHVDLDTVGGCLALMGKKPDDPELWAGAEFIDCHGIHHVWELADTVQRQLNAIYAWQDTHRLERSVEVRDVTEFIEMYGEMVCQVVEKSEELLLAGEVWQREARERTEHCLAEETENLRIFEVPDETFCSAAYYSFKYQKTAKATLVYNRKKKSITLAFEDGGKEYSAKQIVQELWGDLAGGHRGIAGSPRGREMAEQDWKKAKEKMTELM